MTREALLEKLRGIEGYLSDDEAWALYLAAHRCTQNAQNPRIVEVGSYKGRSTVAIGAALAEHGSGSLVSIDPHAPTGKASYAREHGEIDTDAEFHRNIESAGVAEYVRAIRATSQQARPGYDLQPIDMLFVDGSHDYEDVLVDIDLWTPFLRSGAVAAFNDPYAPGVNRALRDRVLRGRLALGEFHHVNNTLFALLGSATNEPAFALYLAVERMRFKLLKLMLRGLLEAARLIYVPASTARSAGWQLFS